MSDNPLPAINLAAITITAIVTMFAVNGVTWWTLILVVLFFIAWLRLEWVSRR